MIGDGAGEKKKCLTVGVLKRIEFSPSDMRDMSVLFVSIFATALFESCTINVIKMIFAHHPCNARTRKKKRNDVTTTSSLTIQTEMMKMIKYSNQRRRKT